MAADRSPVSSGPTGVSALGRCGIQFRKTGSLVSSGPAQDLALGHCGVHFRLTGDGSRQDPLVFRLWDIVGLVQAEWVSGLLRTCWSFSFGTFWNSVQGYGNLAIEDPLGLWLWDIVVFSSS